MTDFPDNLLANDDLLERVAARECWELREREDWERIRIMFEHRLDIHDLFLIAPPGHRPLEERAIGVGSWPRWESVRLNGGLPYPVLDAAARLAGRFRRD